MSFSTIVIIAVKALRRNATKRSCVPSGGRRRPVDMLITPHDKRNCVVRDGEGREIFMTVVRRGGAGAWRLRGSIRRRSRTRESDNAVTAT